jgi:hypothetical protein
MDWSVWERLEPVLLRFGVKPILAVVPDNRDPSLVVGPARVDFWERVRHWQQVGWTIALHGYQHLYETRDAGLLGVNAYSEFSGLTESVQAAKLDAALDVFRAHGVRAQAWVAPAHSFDRTTVRLLVDRGVRVISDGFYLRPVHRYGAMWIPQQLWRFRPAPVGLWTVCFHANGMDECAIARFEADVERYAPHITAVPTVLSRQVSATPGWVDHAVAGLWLSAVRLRRQRSTA